MQSASGDEKVIGLIARLKSLCTKVSSRRIQEQKQSDASTCVVVLGAVLKMGTELNEAEGVDGMMWFGI